MFVAWIVPIVSSLVVGLVVAIGIASATQKVGVGLFSGLLVALLVLGVWSGLSSFTTVDSGYVGVVTRFGEVTGKVLPPGLNWKTPHVEKVLEIATRNRTYQTATDAHGTGDFNDYPIDTNTSDGQRITATYNITFFIAKECTPDVVIEFTTLENFVRTVAVPKFRSITRNEMKAFTAEELQQLASLTEVEENTLLALETELAPFCLTVTSYDVRDIDFDKDYLQAIENQQIAEENIQTAAFEADAESERARQKIVAAQAQADILRIDAEAKADALLINAEAQAEAIREIGNQLERYPNYIQLQFVEGLGENISWGILPDDIVPLMQMDTPQ